MIERDPKSQTPPEFRAPETPEPVAIPDHQLLRRIGRGSYGEVWLARSVTGAYRAVKIVHRRAFDHDRPFEREFSGILKFEPISRKHESQMDILHVGRGDDCFFYVMELADDQFAGQQINPDSYAPKTLKSELFQRGKLPFEECVQISLSLTTALDNLHSQGLVHRDIKPSNVIFVNGVVKLSDIGLVTGVDASRSFVGTEGFVPPEGPGTPQADLYSLGKVLYEICTGKDRQEFPELPADLDAWPDREGLLELNAVIVKACREDPLQRYASAQAMHRELLLLQSGKSLARLHASERTLARVKRITVAAGAVVLLLAAGLGVAAIEWRQARIERDGAVQARTAEEAQRKAAQAAQKVAETEAAKSKQVSRFLEDMLRGVDASEVLGRDTTVLREILDRTAARIGNELTNQPEVEAEMRLTLSAVYNSLGLWSAQLDMASNALRIARLRLGEGHPLTASALALTGTAYCQAGHYAQGEVLLRQAVANFRKRHVENAQLCFALGELGVTLGNQGKTADAEAVFGEALTVDAHLFGKVSFETYNDLVDSAGALGAQGKYVQEELVCREAFSIARELAPSDKVKGFEAHEGCNVLEPPIKSLTECLHLENKTTELDQLYRELEPTSRDSPLQAAALLRARAGSLALYGRWDSAAKDMGRVLQLDPTNPLQYHAMLPLLVANGDVEGYRQICQRSLALFAASSSPYIADRIAKDSCILPSSGVDLTVVGQVASRTEAGNSWFQLTRGLVAYRQGHFADAMDWTQKALKVEGAWARRDVEAWMVLAMAQYQQGHFDEARAALAGGVKATAADWYSAADGHVGNDWEDWIIGQALTKEAKALIEGTRQ
jgi:tetratricopeptide (TPR) repeat protein